MSVLLISLLSIFVGQFSKFWIETRSSDGKPKNSGGDSWRVHINGPSSPVTAVLDLQNGLYEVVFLLFEPGIYTVKAFLEYTMCNGLKEPPKHWFIIGKNIILQTRKGAIICMWHRTCICNDAWASETEIRHAGGEDLSAGSLLNLPRDPFPQNQLLCPFEFLSSFFETLDHFWGKES